jgi:CheY-like chemotaxis protein
MKASKLSVRNGGAEGTRKHLLAPQLTPVCTNTVHQPLTVASDSCQAVTHRQQWQRGHVCDLLLEQPTEALVGKIRVVLADDHQAVTTKVRGTISEKCEVIAAVEDGEQAIAAVLALDPDVLVIDISMPVLDGLQAAKRLQKVKCRARIVFLTIHEDHDYVAAAFSYGAIGYVTKARLSTDLVPAIVEAMQGHTFVSRFTPSKVTIHPKPL